MPQKELMGTRVYTHLPPEATQLIPELALSVYRNTTKKNQNRECVSVCQHSSNEVELTLWLAEIKAERDCVM